jgi:signal transduction histidine kinase
MGRFTRDLTLVDPIEATELLFEMRTLPATNCFNGARGTVCVLANITDLRYATEQPSSSRRVSHGAGPEFLMSDSVHIQIRDTRTGIAEEHLPHIFEPFFSTKDEKGTGLGLWVSQGIGQAHGGSIKLRSREGRGTTFSVALPIGGPAENVER